MASFDEFTRWVLLLNLVGTYCKCIRKKLKFLLYLSMHTTFRPRITGGFRQLQASFNRHGTEVRAIDKNINKTFYATFLHYTATIQSIQCKEIYTNYNSQGWELVRLQYSNSVKDLYNMTLSSNNSAHFLKTQCSADLEKIKQHLAWHFSRLVRFCQ